ncbi:UNVERIFIED_CONTAM: hypothetical protein GTU68_003302 [Idotea baltica]|nr:hypothetical protein [Idotea baltica]
MLTFATGSHLVKLRVATNESYKDKDGNFNDVTNWHTVSAWGKLAERMVKLSKGQHVLIRGKLENRSWEDKEGRKRRITQVKANDFALLSKVESTQKETVSDALPF